MIDEKMLNYMNETHMKLRWDKTFDDFRTNEFSKELGIKEGHYFFLSLRDMEDDLFILSQDGRLLVCRNGVLEGTNYTGDGYIFDFVIKNGFDYHISYIALFKDGKLLLDPSLYRTEKKESKIRIEAVNTLTSALLSEDQKMFIKSVKRIKEDKKYRTYVICMYPLVFCLKVLVDSIVSINSLLLRGLAWFMRKIY